MEPTLKDGDIVVVRKSDIYWWHRVLDDVQHGVGKGNPPDPPSRGKRATDSKANGTNPEAFDQPQGHFSSEKRRENEERRTVLRLEANHCQNPAADTPYWIYQKPPVARTGHVVVYQNPNEYPSTWNIKRAVGLGCQVVRLFSLNQALVTVAATSSILRLASNY